MKSLILSISILLFSGASMAQQSTMVKSSNWTQKLNNTEVEISYKLADCNFVMEGFHNEYMLVKYKNKTNQTLRLEWKFDYYYNGKCANCNYTNGEDVYTIDLKPGETLEGKCEWPTKRTTMIFSKFLNRNSNAELTNFEFSNLKIVKTN